MNGSHILDHFRLDLAKAVSEQSQPPPENPPLNILQWLAMSLTQKAILTVTRLGLPVELRRSLACTSIIENMNGTIARDLASFIPPKLSRICSG